MNFEQKVYTRHEDVDGINEWCWSRDDSGTWDGPHREWPGFKKFWYPHIKNFDVCVQAGGAQGMYPKLLARDFKLVYTFEPTPLSFYILNKNCIEENIIKMQAALGECHKMIRMDINNSNLGSNRINKDGFGGFIPMLMIDDLALDKCDFVQLDVEDSEIGVINGAIETLKKFKPVISMEKGHSPEIIAFMTALGYKEVGAMHSDTLWKVENE